MPSHPLHLPSALGRRALRLGGLGALTLLTRCAPAGEATPDAGRCEPRGCAAQSCGTLDDGCGGVSRCPPCSSTLDGGDDAAPSTTRDAGPDAEGPPRGRVLLYRVDYEDGTSDAHPGASRVELAAGAEAGGTLSVALNPHVDAVNPSRRVGQHSVPAGYRRAELSSQRLPTEGQAYVYKWSTLLSSTFFDAPQRWNTIAQWKTWPCGEYDRGYGDRICGTGGIFNDARARPGSVEFRYRAEPACFDANPTLTLGQWVRFTQEIYWTRAGDGYVRLWQDEQLVYERAGVQTLFDDFDAVDCNLYFAVGVYADSSAGLSVYTDDIEIWSP